MTYCKHFIHVSCYKGLTHIMLYHLQPVDVSQITGYFRYCKVKENIMLFSWGKEMVFICHEYGMKHL